VVRCSAMAWLTEKAMGKMRRGLAAVLAVWLSGIVFLLCCHAMAGKMPESCPLAKMGGHCKKSADDARPRLSADADDESLTGCAYLPVVFDKSRKTEAKARPAAPAATAITLKYVPPTVSTAKRESSSFYDPVFYSDRTLAKHCVLRI
jgi:hypothetical protein